MRVNYAHVCDYATVGANGKPVLVGIFARIFASQLPAVHDRFHVFVCFEMGPEDSGQQCNLEVALFDPEGAQVVGQSFQITADKMQPRKEQTLNLVWGLVKFDYYGDYELRITASGQQEITVIPLTIVESPNEAGQTPS